MKISDKVVDKIMERVIDRISDSILKECPKCGHIMLKTIEVCSKCGESVPMSEEDKEKIAEGLKKWGVK